MGIGKKTKQSKIDLNFLCELLQKSGVGCTYNKTWYK